MKYKVEILNEVSGKAYQGEFDSIEEREAYVERVLTKKQLGLGEREILKANLPQELEGRVISESTKYVVVTQLDENGEEVETVENLEYVRVKSDFVVELSEVSNYEELRKKEYPSLEEVLHTLLDHGLDSVEMADLQSRRAATKAKYPKE